MKLLVVGSGGREHAIAKKIIGLRKLSKFSWLLVMTGCD